METAKLFDLVKCLVKCGLMQVAISEFKAKCIQMIKSAAENDQELLVTLRGKPLAKVTGIPTVRQRMLGGQRDAVAADLPDAELMASDFENDWEA
jgi:prevent-host-death family protein